MEINVLLCLTGSVASIKIEPLIAAFQHHGCNVKIVATKAARHFIRHRDCVAKEERPKGATPPLSPSDVPFTDSNQSDAASAPSAALTPRERLIRLYTQYKPRGLADLDQKLADFGAPEIFFGRIRRELDITVEDEELAYRTLPDLRQATLVSILYMHRPDMLAKDTNNRLAKLRPTDSLVTKVSQTLGVDARAAFKSVFGSFIEKVEAVHGPALTVVGSVLRPAPSRKAPKPVIEGIPVSVPTSPSGLYVDTPGGKMAVLIDDDEWNIWQRRGDTVLHIELQKWADVLVLAPLSANTLAKLAGGLADNLVTSIARAWPWGRKSVVLAPAMNTLMWEHPATQEHLAKLQQWGREFMKVVAPVSKQLVCGDTGLGAMAAPEDIAMTAVLTLVGL